MFNHLLIFFALISFSIVSYTAVIPMDADQVATDAIQNAVLHKEVAVIQGGRADKDVAHALAITAIYSCPVAAICSRTKAAMVDTKSPTVSEWFVVQGGTSALQPIAVLLLISGLIVLFLSRKSVSTK